MPNFNTVAICLIMGNVYVLHHHQFVIFMAKQYFIQKF
jgi:hypothetical protein